MYVKKYMTFDGNISGTLKYETIGEKTSIHVRLSRNPEEVYRVYLFNKSNERKYAGIVDEYGVLSYECDGIYDALQIIKRDGEDENVISEIFTGERYDLTTPVDEISEKSEIEAAHHEDLQIESENGDKNTDNTDNMKFYIASADASENEGDNVDDSDDTTSDESLKEGSKGFLFDRRIGADFWKILLIILLFIQNNREKNNKDTNV